MERVNVQLPTLLPTLLSGKDGKDVHGVAHKDYLMPAGNDVNDKLYGERLARSQVPNLLPTWDGKSLVLSNVYEHVMVLNGIRYLDANLSGDGLLEFPKGRGSVRSPRFFRGLLSGVITLSSIPDQEAVDAQPDVKRLTLEQAVRLCVLVLDKSTLGYGSSGRAGFVTALQKAVCCKLAERIFTRDEHAQIGEPDRVRLAREALLMMAVSSMAELSWWCWWLPLASSDDGPGKSEMRMFFNVHDLQLRSEFPCDGVWEYRDYTRPDQNDASGHRSWFHWQISHRRSLADISAYGPSRISRGKVSLKDVQDALANLRRSQ